MDDLSGECLCHPMNSPALMVDSQVLKAVAHQSNISTDQVMTIVHLEEPLLAELNKFVGLVETLNLEADSARSAEQDADFALKMSAINKVGASIWWGRCDFVVAMFALECTRGLCK